MVGVSSAPTKFLMSAEKGSANFLSTPLLLLFLVWVFCPGPSPWKPSVPSKRVCFTALLRKVFNFSFFPLGFPLDCSRRRTSRGWGGCRPLNFLIRESDGGMSLGGGAFFPGKAGVLLFCCDIKKWRTLGRNDFRPTCEGDPLQVVLIALCYER